jgi:hypothetical protein
MNSTAKIVVFAVCALTTLTASWPARAETITLWCKFGEQFQKYSVDLTRSTVNDAPATITATRIIMALTTTTPWQGAIVTNVNYYIFDRVTDIMTHKFSSEYRGRPGDGDGYEATHKCTEGNSPPPPPPPPITQF